MSEINGQQINRDKDGMRSNPANILDWALAIIFPLLFLFVMDYQEIGKDLGYTPGIIGRIFMFLFAVPCGFCGLKVGRWVRDAIRGLVYSILGHELRV